MPDTSFDRWTRRRFGQAAGALITVPLLAGAASPVDAKHQHHKKKKKPKKGQCLNFQDGACLLAGSPCNPMAVRAAAVSSVRKQKTSTSTNTATPPSFSCTNVVSEGESREGSRLKPPVDIWRA